MAKVSPEQLEDAFALYLKYNGERFDLIEKEMRGRGWTRFQKQQFFDRGRGANFREGWISKYGWKKSLEIKVATAGQTAVTSAESLLFEVETVRKKLYQRLVEKDVNDRDLVYQHDKYVSRTTEILDKLERARDNYGNFTFFLKHLLAAAPLISPELATALCLAEDGLLEWAEREFATDEEAE